MTNPFKGPRHRSWALSNTTLTLILLVVLIIVTAVSDHYGEPPNYLVGLLGTAAGAFFAAIGGDKEKREKETVAIAERAEAKADRLAQVAEHEHPGSEARYDESQSHPEEEGG